MKKKENRNLGSNQASNPDPSYPNLSPLPLHYHTDHAKIPKNLSKHTNKLSFLSVTSITGDPSPFVNFNKNSTWAPTSFFLTLFENAFFAFL